MEDQLHQRQLCDGKAERKPYAGTDREAREDLVERDQDVAPEESIDEQA